MTVEGQSFKSVAKPVLLIIITYVTRNFKQQFEGVSCLQ